MRNFANVSIIACDSSKRNVTHSKAAGTGGGIIFLSEGLWKAMSRYIPNELFLYESSEAHGIWYIESSTGWCLLFTRDIGAKTSRTEVFLPLWPYPALDKPLLCCRKPVHSSRPFSLIQYNPPLEWTWSKKSFSCAAECWMLQCRASASPSSPRQHNTPSLGWHHLRRTQNTEAIKLLLFTMTRPRMPVTKAFVSNLQAASKAEKGAQSLPALPSKPLLGEERWACRAREQIILMSQATTTTPKPYVPNRGCLIRFCHCVWVHGHFE